MNEAQQAKHNIEPIYAPDSRILLLGSFPSVKSREQQFFYAHPQNRFWPLMAELLQAPTPQTIAEKTDLLLQHNIALWDVAAEVSIVGSSDQSLNCLQPNPLERILDAADIQQIYCNGAKAYQLYCKLCKPLYNRPAIKLPSTSPANAAWSIERLKTEWSIILQHLD